MQLNPFLKIYFKAPPPPEKFLPTPLCTSVLRDWSLITGRGGGYKMGGGGHVKFYPYEKGGRKKF